MEKKKYYIHLETQLISQEPSPDGSQIEVFATAEEIAEMRHKFDEMSEISGDALKFLAAPFVESSVDDKRTDYQDELMSLYRLIYDSGTLETKKNMIESGIIKEI